MSAYTSARLLPTPGSSLSTALTVSAPMPSTSNNQLDLVQGNDQDQDRPRAEQQRQHRTLDVPEILNHVGYFLNQKDAVVCVRVSRFWSQAFVPVLWEHVDTSKWSSWLRRKESDQNHGFDNERPDLEGPQGTTLAMESLDQVLVRHGHHIRTLSIADLRTEGLIRLLDHCHRLEILILCPDAFEEDVDDDDENMRMKNRKMIMMMRARWMKDKRLSRNDYDTKGSRQKQPRERHQQESDSESVEKEPEPFQGRGFYRLRSSK